MNLIDSKPAHQLIIEYEPVGDYIYTCSCGDWPMTYSHDAFAIPSWCVHVTGETGTGTNLMWSQLYKGSIVLSTP